MSAVCWQVPGGRALSPPERRSRAFGAFAGLSRLGTAPGAAPGGELAVTVGYGAAFLGAAALVVLGAATTLTACRRVTRPPR